MRILKRSFHLIRLFPKRKRKNKYPGFFITFEGVEGSGKSTQISLLASFLKNKRLPVFITREPGGTPAGKKMRRILLDPKNRSLTPFAELLLMLADRNQHVEECILPRLQEGRIVLCDRYSDSTVAYQSSGRDLSLRFIRRLNRLATGGLRPDLTFLMVPDLKKTLKKAKALSGEYKGGDRIEQESYEFHRRVEKQYLRLAVKYPRRIVPVPLQKKPRDTADHIASACAEKLKQRGLL